jgi:deferrochelatase/peroxidase EfeB
LIFSPINETESKNNGEDDESALNTLLDQAKVALVLTTARSCATSHCAAPGRLSPYRGEYVILSVDDAAQGREMVRRMIAHIAPSDEWWAPSLPGWLGVAFTYAGLKALGVPQTSSDSFPIKFKQGMAARAAILRDFGENAPSNSEYPFGTADMHVALAIYANDEKNLDL